MMKSSIQLSKTGIVLTIQIILLHMLTQKHSGNSKAEKLKVIKIQYF